MPSSYSRLPQIRFWVHLVTAVAVVAGLTTAAIPMFRNDLEFAAITFHLIAAVAILLAAGTIWVLAQFLFKIEANANRIHELLIETNDTLGKQAEMISTIRDNSQISDGAKSITHRTLEREALRKAIQEDILKEDWESAYALIEEMEQRFGYRLEAYTYRREVDQFRTQVIEDRIETSLKSIRELVGQQHWNMAQAEIDRLARLAPKDARLDEVISEATARKDAYKNSLLAEWHEVVEKKDLDRGIALLKEIDPYLSHEEVKKLEDSARSIFKAKLMDLGVRFRAAVKERRWPDAVQIGEEIRHEFPNSLMAREVGDSMEALKAKAAGP